VLAIGCSSVTGQLSRHRAQRAGSNVTTGLTASH
jgi:hypothetical protein